MDDRALVAAMAFHDPRGLDGAYRRYAGRLHAYCRSLVSDRDAAADIVHDTFVIASERVSQLRDPDRLSAWLYAIARSECLRALRRRKRTMPLSDTHDVVAETPEPAAAVQAAQVRALVRAASDGLSPGDREVIELAVRHGFSAAEVGAVLGVSANHAHARISRARSQLEAALGALLVARAGRGRCAALGDLLHGWDGQLTALLRKRINRHVNGCASCQSGRREWLSPAALLSAYAGLPFATFVGRPHTPGAGESTVDDVPPFDRRTGFPRDATPKGRRTAVAAGVAAVLLLGAAAVLSRGPGSERTDLVVAFVQPSVPPTAAVSAGPGEPGFGAAPPSASAPEPAGTGAPPSPGNPPSQPPESTPKPPVPSLVLVVPFSIRAAARVSCVGGIFSLTVGAETAGGKLASARLYWRALTTRSRAMTVSGQTAQFTVDRVFTDEVDWWVTASATDGRTVSTDPETAGSPCP